LVPQGIELVGLTEQLALHNLLKPSLDLKVKMLGWIVHHSWALGFVGRKSPARHHKPCLLCIVQVVHPFFERAHRVLKLVQGWSVSCIHRAGLPFYPAFISL
jgi:hypothetical protein